MPSSIRTVRLDDSESKLARTLRAYRFVEFWQPVDSFYGDDPANWPADARASLLIAKSQWLNQAGPIDILARVYACVPHENGKHACVLQFVYRRIGPVLSETPGGSRLEAAAAAVSED